MQTYALAHRHATPALLLKWLCKMISELVLLLVQGFQVVRVLILPTELGTRATKSFPQILKCLMIQSCAVMYQ